MLYSLIIIIMICITTRIGLLLRLFVLVSIGFDLVVLISMFKIRFKHFFKADYPEPSFKVPLIIPIVYILFLMTVFITPIIKDQDINLLIPLALIICFGFIYALVKKIEYIPSYSFENFEKILCKLLNLE